MQKTRIFISSVQSEFASERQMLFEYISNDALLGRFFEVFIFENLPASDKNVRNTYIEKVERCDIYIGLFGREYGYEDEDGVSPTEREFDHASLHAKTRLIFLSHCDFQNRHSKMQMLIQKAEGLVVRKQFSSPEELKTAVYAALVNFMDEKELIRTVPFDAAICKKADLDDINPARISWFIQLAKDKRNFPLPLTAKPMDVLTHLNLLKPEGLTNAAVLLFGKQPQEFFITAEMRCALFPGFVAEKPITSYQVYKGDIFQQVDAAVDFVLSRIDLFIGDRSQSTDVPTRYEIPPAALKEAIVNAIAHRDYTSNASVQIMLFRNRLEIWNPGQLPYQLTVSKLKQPHASYPANPLLAESLYLAGYIERMGTGIPDMLKECVEAGLKEPEFFQDEAFKTTLWRKVNTYIDTPHDTPHDAPHDTPHDIQDVPSVLDKLIIVFEGELTRQEMQDKVGIKDRKYFREKYLDQAISIDIIIPVGVYNPKDKTQKYKLTEEGKTLQKILRLNKK